MSSSSVQFRNAESAIKAFENTDCEAWSIWQGKQMLYKGIGCQDLEAFIEMLASQASNAIYTLAYYEDIDNKKSINSKTPNDGSFNFRLNSDGMEITNGQYKRIGEITELQSRISALENGIGQILERVGEPLEEEEEPNRLGLIGDIISHPVIAPLLPQLLSLITGTNSQPAGSTGQAPAGNNVPPKYVQMGAVGEIPNQREHMLQQAIERLKLADNALPEHLTKLADLAEQKPDTFALLLSSLENMI